MSKTMFPAGRIALLLAGLTTGVGCGDQNSLESGPASQGNSPVEANGSSTPAAASKKPAATVSAPTPAADGCAAPIDFHDGAVDGLALGPNNQVFGAPSVTKDPVMNYESQVVFPNPSLTMTANFGEPVGGTVGSLAELAIPLTSCASLAGRKVRVTVLWHLDGTIVETPIHGLSLGSSAAGAPVDFSDAAISCVPDPNASGAVIDGGCGARTLNTLNPVELVHTFAAGEDLSGGLFLRVHLMSTQGAVPTTFHVASISWE